MELKLFQQYCLNKAGSYWSIPIEEVYSIKIRNIDYDTELLFSNGLVESGIELKNNELKNYKKNLIN